MFPKKSYMKRGATQALATSKVLEIFAAASDLAVGRFYHDICEAHAHGAPPSEREKWTKEMDQIHASSPEVVAKQARAWVEQQMGTLRGEALRTFMLRSIQHVSSLDQAVS